MDNVYEKKGIRKTILDARALIPEHDVMKNSQKIIEKIFQLEHLKVSKTIMCYLNFRNEVMTGSFIRKCIEEGKKIAVPLIISNTPEKKEMVASIITDMEESLEKGTYGILEPKREKIEVLEPKDLDLVIVPGVAFDLNKNRIGYGAGYYDRFLRGVNNSCLKVGIAFEMQIVDSVPADENDVKLDLLITENRII